MHFGWGDFKKYNFQVQVHTTTAKQLRKVMKAGVHSSSL